MTVLKTICILTVVVLFAAGCTASQPGVRISGTTTAKKHQGQGPPPHAPAHGYRAKHKGHDLVFDTGLGVYVVMDLPDVFFHNGLYLRKGEAGQWQVSAEPGGAWRPAASGDVPYSLKTKQNQGGPGKAKGKKHKGKAKGKNKTW